MNPLSPQALFLDRDGTLIRWVDYLCDPEKVELCEGVSEALLLAKQAGCLLFLHTNQSGVGRGYFGIDEVHAVNERMCELMGIDVSFFDGVCIATDHPVEAVLGETYRKPSPRYALETMKRHSLEAKRSYMIGDSLSDVNAGLNAGINSVLVRSEQTGEVELPESVLECSSVSAFVAEHF